MAPAGRTGAGRGELGGAWPGRGQCEREAARDSGGGGRDGEEQGEGGGRAAQKQEQQLAQERRANLQREQAEQWRRGKGPAAVAGDAWAMRCAPARPPQRTR